jgi:hypothetical protein
MKMPLLGIEPRTAEWITTTTVLDVRLQQLGNLLGKNTNGLNNLHKKVFKNSSSPVPLFGRRKKNSRV